MIDDVNILKIYSGNKYAWHEQSRRKWWKFEQMVEGSEKLASLIITTHVSQGTSRRRRLELFSSLPWDLFFCFRRRISPSQTIFSFDWFRSVFTSGPLSLSLSLFDHGESFFSPSRPCSFFLHWHMSIRYFLFCFIPTSGNAVLE